MVRRDREPDRLHVAARVAERIHADDGASHVEQRTAAVSGIDRGVGLNHHDVTVVRTALTIPRVTVPINPFGDPTATTSSPARTVEISATGRALLASSVLDRSSSTARSVRAEHFATVAVVWLLRSAESSTSTVEPASSMTCLFVMIR